MIRIDLLTLATRYSSSANAIVVLPAPDSPVNHTVQPLKAFLLPRPSTWPRSFRETLTYRINMVSYLNRSDSCRLLYYLCSCSTTLVAPEESLRMRLVLCRLLGVASPPLESSQDGGGVGELIIPATWVEIQNRTDSPRLIESCTLLF